MKSKPSILRIAGALLLACLGSTSQPPASAATLVAQAPENVHQAVVAEDGRILYVGTGSNPVRRTFYICNPQALGFSADGKYLAAAGGSNCRTRIKVWRVADGSQLCDLPTADDGTEVLALSTNGSSIVCATTDGRLSAWALPSGTRKWSHKVSLEITSVRFAEDGKRLHIQCADRTQHTLDSSSGRIGMRRTPVNKRRIRDHSR